MLGTERNIEMKQLHCVSDTRVHTPSLFWRVYGPGFMYGFLQLIPLDSLLRLDYCPLIQTQSRVVTGLLTGHNTLRKHFYIMGLIDSLCVGSVGAKEETSAHVLCKCEALITLRHHYLGSPPPPRPFFVDPEDVRNLSLGAIWNFITGTGLPWLRICFKGHKGPAKMA
jgi:hypothetical protein